LAKKIFRIQGKTAREMVGYPHRVSMVAVTAIPRRPSGKVEEFLSLWPG